METSWTAWEHHRRPAGRWRHSMMTRKSTLTSRTMMTTLTTWTTLAVARVPPTPKYLPRAHPANWNCHPHNCDVTIICLLLNAIWNRNWRFVFSNSSLKDFQKVCKKNDLDRVLPSVDVVLLLTLHGPRYWVFHRFHMCIPLFYRLLFIVQICLIMWLSKHFHFIWSAKTLYMYI